MDEKLMIIQERMVLSWAQRSVLATGYYRIETELLTTRLQFIPAKEAKTSDNARKAVLETRDGGSSTAK